MHRRPGPIIILVAALGLLFPVAEAPAAPIAWGPALSTATPGDILTAGRAVEAINAINSNTGYVTVNGVMFTNSNALLPKSVGGNFLAGNSTGDAGLDALLNKLDYGGGTSPSISIGGGHLNPGDQYQVQVFFTDLRAANNNHVMTFGDGEAAESSVDLHASQGGFGQYGVGTFTADATSQALTLATNGFGNAHITAYQLRTLTAPPVTTSLPAHWKLDETGGSTAADSADAHHGTTVNAIPHQPGIVGSNLAYEFRGAGGTNTGGNDRVVIDDGFFLDDYNRLAIAAWIKPDTLGGQVGHGGSGGNTGRAIIEGEAERDALAFQVGDEDDVYGFLRFGDNSGTTLEVRTNDGPVVTDEWQHVAMTYAANDIGDGGVMTLYVNGMQVAQKSHSNANNTIDTSDVADALLIGVHAPNADGSGTRRNRFDGLLDDLGLWGGTDSPLMPGPVEIAAIHALGKFAGVGLDDPDIDVLLAAFDAGPGSLVSVGGIDWLYRSGLSAGGDLGATGGTVADYSAFVILDGQGNGMQAYIPEPATVGLLALGGLGLLRRRRREDREGS